MISRCSFVRRTIILELHEDEEPLLFILSSWHKNNGGLERVFDQKQEPGPGRIGQKLQVLPSGRKIIRNRRRSVAVTGSMQ